MKEHPSWDADHDDFQGAGVSFFGLLREYLSCLQVMLRVHVKIGPNELSIVQLEE